MTTEYKPDWDSIPKEFKYCYYFTHASIDDGRQLILSVNNIPCYDNREYMKRADRPPELVDGAWYACSDRNYRFIGQYSKRDNLITQGMEYRKPHELTIHNRIPDELWNG